MKRSIAIAILVMLTSCTITACGVGTNLEPEQSTVLPPPVLVVCAVGTACK